MSNDPIREAFEAWAVAQDELNYLRRMPEHSPHSGEYRAYAVESAWRGWQEAWRLAWHEGWKKGREPVTKEGKP